MAEDQNKEEPRFSRSGRVLKKTFKIKEMENFEIKGGRQDKARSHLITPSKHQNLVDKQYEVDEGRMSNSTGFLNFSPSSDTDCEEFYSTFKTKCQVTSSSLKTFERNRLNDVYSSDADGTESMSTDSNSESEENSENCLRVNSKQRILKKNPKTKYATFLRLPNVKYKARRRKTTVAAKMLFTKIKTSEHAIVVSSYYSQRKTAKIEDINKMLRITELCESLGGAHDISRREKEAGYIEQANLQHFGNFSKEINYKSPKRGIVKNKPDRQEHPLLSPVLGTSPIDVAAHLTLLGNCLSNIGSAVANLDDIKPGIYFSLLDMLLCSVGPLLCLTRNIFGLETLPEDVFIKILDHFAYIVPNI